VESLEERMDRLKHEIQRSIVSEETFGRYKQLQEDLYSQMVHENEEFNITSCTKLSRKRENALTPTISIEKKSVHTICC
jgi:hypothetical protein